MKRRRIRSLLIGLSLWAPAAIGYAQTLPTLPAAETPKGVFVPADKITKLADKPQGWSYSVTLGANLNVSSNHDVVGQVEGNSFLFGASILSRVGYLRGPHEWLNTGSLLETWSRTPAVDDFVKSNDLLDLQSLYNYFINEYTGPFTRLAFQTGLLPTRRVTGDPETYVNEDDVDEADPETISSSKFKLSDSFQPLTISESLGWFVQPVHSDRLNVFGRAGFGGRHTFADGARAITDSDESPVVYTVLKDVHQGGAELFAGLDAKEVEGRLLYSVGLMALFPLVSNDNTDRSILKLTRVQLQAAVGIGVFSWMSLNYQLKVLRDVQLVDAVQIQNALLLSFQYSVSSPKPAAKPTPLPPEAEAKIAELEARAIAAEDRANKAEARAQDAVTPAPPAIAPEPLPAPSSAPTEPAPLPSTPR